MNKVLIIGSSILVLISILITPHEILKYTTSQSGNFATVKLIKLPNCDRRYKNKFLSIEFQDSMYTFRTSCKYTKHLIAGQEIEMLHKPGKNVFIFKEENVVLDLVSSIAIGLLGFGGIILILFK